MSLQPNQAVIFTNTRGVKQSGIYLRTEKGNPGRGSGGDWLVVSVDGVEKRGRAKSVVAA